MPASSKASSAATGVVTGKITTKNQQILLPIAPITPKTIDDKTKVIPWNVDPVWLELTKAYFPQYTGLY